MWEYFFGVGEFFTRNVLSLVRTQWMWLSAALVVLGFVCMRGFGSRTNY
jgi:hypothetical protein